ncbi:chloramphenicol-sensitive protein RarD [Leucobacter exalbidus]|uniref:Chloramphenicol-sensitive protein RarD n=1 Tax=Leucobacter exalbidus TaxID=662960 RepID=A0A940PPI8_9MICO|nr:EamA family transporter RarD [Leucobacter exalbidus]MBP1326963.1 chloramphenicol-sensitive protein RarD [Leucobacter exalbidus]
MSRALGQDARGTLASIGSSVAFGGIYFLTPLLSPAPAESIWAVRNIITIPIIALALVMARQWHLFGDVARLMRRKPWVILGVLVCGAIIAAQLWVFAWAPLNGQGLQVALGYFLLPLVLVLVGRFAFKDKLAWWQWAAAAVAAAGVAFEIVRVGEISWETLLVAIGYPIYFTLRRVIGTGHLGGMLWEFIVLIPLAVVLLVFELSSGTALAVNPALAWSVPVYSACAAGALVLYIMASRLLTMSVFGLLSYLEPALLMIAALLIGERIIDLEWGIYLAVWVAVFTILGGGISQMVRARRPR